MPELQISVFSYFIKIYRPVLQSAGYSFLPICVTGHAHKKQYFMVTIYEIAKKANVSVGTVDRVIHKRGRVSRETAEKVNRLIKEMGYRPNVMARNLSLKKTYQMGILIPEREQDGGYWDLQAKGIDKAVQDMQMYNVRSSFFYYDKYSEQSFDTACQEVLEQKDKLAGLIIAPVLSKASERFIRIIPEDLPYIFIDSYIPNSQCLSYIGQDSIQSGVLAGKLMSLLVVSKGTIVIMRVLPEDYHITDRIEGFSSVLQSRKDIQIKMIDADRMADHQILYKLARELSKMHEDLRGIFIPHACAFQVAESLNGHLQSDGIHIIGYDLVEYNRKYLKDGIIDFIISQRPENQGFQAVSTLYKHVVLRQAVDQKIVIPMDIITKENVNYYQI